MGLGAGGGRKQDKAKQFIIRRRSAARPGRRGINQSGRSTHVLLITRGLFQPREDEKTLEVDLDSARDYESMHLCMCDWQSTFQNEQIGGITAHSGLCSGNSSEWEHSVTFSSDRKRAPPAKNEFVRLPNRRPCFSSGRAGFDTRRAAEETESALWSRAGGTGDEQGRQRYRQRRNGCKTWVKYNFCLFSAELFSLYTHWEKNPFPFLTVPRRTWCKNGGQVAKLRLSTQALFRLPA